MNGNLIESSVSVFASQLASPQPRDALHLWSRQSSGSSGCSGWLYPVSASPQERFFGSSAGGTLSLHTGTSTTCRWFAPGLLRQSSAPPDSSAPGVAPQRSCRQPSPCPRTPGTALAESPRSSASSAPQDGKPTRCTTDLSITLSVIGSEPPCTTRDSSREWLRHTLSHLGASCEQI